MLIPLRSSPSTMFTKPISHSTRRLKQFNLLGVQTRLFHPTSVIMVKVGDSVPNVDLFEGSPGNKVNLASEIASGDAVLVGVPAAFSPGCSDHHIPSYLMHPDIKKHKVYVISVNDAFVMKAWGKKLDDNSESGIRFLADPAAAFTKELDLLFDAEAYFGNKRGKRYAIKTTDGKVTSVQVEEDPSKITVSGADKNL